MGQHKRQYAYRLTARGIEYVMNRCIYIPDNTHFGDAADTTVSTHHIIKKNMG